MSSWISKAANVFRKEGPAPPPQFEISCECGQAHTGVRRSRHQHIVCKSCGVSLFVLPKDIYPAGSPDRLPPIAEKAESGTDYDLDTPLTEPLPGRREKSRSKEAVSEAVFEESGESIPLVKPPERPAPVPTLIPEEIVVPPSKKKRHAADEHKSRRRREKKSEEEFEEEVKGPGLLTRVVGAIRQQLYGIGLWLHRTLIWAGIGFIRFWTPLRLTLLAIALVVTGAITYSVRQSMLEQAGRIIREKSEAITQALEKKEWLTARRELEPVVAALDRLGRDDNEANVLRQQLRETTAMSLLSGVSLYDFLMAAEETTTKDGSTAWQDKFRSLYSGDWFVVEGSVEQITERIDGQISRGYAVSLPWTVGDSQRPVVMRADLAEFRSLRVGETPTPVMFAAPLKSCRLDADDEWRIEFDGEQGFLWVDMDRYKELGFTFDPLRSEGQTQSLLDAQGRVMGIRP